MLEEFTDLPVLHFSRHLTEVVRVSPLVPVSGEEHAHVVVGATWDELPAEDQDDDEEQDSGCGEPDDW